MKTTRKNPLNENNIPNFKSVKEALEYYKKLGYITIEEYIDKTYKIIKKHL